MPFGREKIQYEELKNIPKKEKLIYVRIMLMVLPGILLGGYAGKKMAQFLEVCDLFTPDTVDNDD